MVAGNVHHRKCIGVTCLVFSLLRVLRVSSPLDQGQRPRRKVVICGSYRQFREWCRENGVHDRMAIYPDFPEKLYGLELKKEDIVYYGTLPDNLHLIEEVLRTRIR